MGCGTYRHTKAPSRYFWNTTNMWWPCGQISPPIPHNSSKITRINRSLGSISAGITDSSPMYCWIMRLIIAGDWISWWNKGHRSAIISLTMHTIKHYLCKILKKCINANLIRNSAWIAKRKGRVLTLTMCYGVDTCSIYY